MTAQAIAMSIASAILMLYSGLLFEPAMIRQFANRRHVRLLGRISLVNFIIIPFATLLLISVFPATPDIKLVLITLAMMPCAPLVPTLVSMAGESPQWSLFLFLCFSLLSFLLLPVLLIVLSQPWAAGDSAKLGSGNYAGLVLYVVTVYPLFLGIVFRLLNADRSRAMLKFVRPLVSISITIALLLFAVTRWREIVNLRGTDVGVLLTFQFICVAAVMMFGPSWRAAPMTHILPTGFRNFTLGLALSSAVFPHTKALSYMMAFTILLVPLVVLAFAMQRRSLSRCKKLGLMDNVSWMCASGAFVVHTFGGGKNEEQSPIQHDHVACCGSAVFAVRDRGGQADAALCQSVPGTVELFCDARQEQCDLIGRAERSKPPIDR